MLGHTRPLCRSSELSRFSDISYGLVAVTQGYRLFERELRNDGAPAIAHGEQGKRLSRTGGGGFRGKLKLFAPLLVNDGFLRLDRTWMDGRVSYNSSLQKEW